MENRLTYQPQVDNLPDNQTIWRKLPYDTRQSSFFATNYGAILRRMKQGISVVRLNKALSQTNRPHAIKHGLDKRGTYQIKSHHSPIDGKLIYRLIAAAFCPNDNPARNQVDHIDNNPANQRADNLRWCTGKENMQFYREIRTGKRVISNLDKARFYV